MAPTKFYLLNACFTDGATYHSREPVGIFTTLDKVAAAKIEYNRSFTNPNQQVKESNDSYWEVVEIEADKMIVK